MKAMVARRYVWMSCWLHNDLVLIEEGKKALAAGSGYRGVERERITATTAERTSNRTQPLPAGS